MHPTEITLQSGTFTKKRKNMAKPISQIDDEAGRTGVDARVQLGQWRALRAVVDAGSYARAAERLHRSQSAITYAVQKLEEVLGVRVFELRGRKAVLTSAGETLYRRAGVLLEDARALERVGRELGAGVATEVRLAVDTMFPSWLLLEALARFAAECPTTRLEIRETVLGGSEELLRARSVDLAVAVLVPDGLLGDPLLQLHFVAVAAPMHPLFGLRRPVTQRDLRGYRQLVIRDSATEHPQSSGWLGANTRWTVSQKATSIRAAQMGLGFAWYPEEIVHAELESGQLKKLPLREGARRDASLYLVFADADYAGPTVQRIAAILRDTVRDRNPTRSRAHRRGSARGMTTTDPSFPRPELPRA